jgi:hypothetical protein
MALARENFTQMQTNGNYEKEMFLNVKWRFTSCTLRIGCIDRIRQMNTADEVPNGNAREMRALSGEIKSIGMF